MKTMAEVEAVLYEEVLPGGGMWSMRVRRQQRLALTALEAGANVSCLVFNAAQPLDRLNVPDTLKALHTAKITQGHVLMSDMGHALLSVVEDSLGWHDPLGGCIDAELVREKFGERPYQEARNGFFRNAHENFLVELAKHGLGEPDLVANVNWFSRVVVDDEGRMELVPGHAPAGARIVLRAEMDCLVVLANCPHPMAAGPDYPFVPVELTLSAGPPPAEDDFCRNFRPECARALALSERYYL
jgi:urea carboxylase-associated protein 2